MLKILFIGSLGTQSLITLQGLLAGGHRVSVVAVAGSALGVGNGAGSPPPRFIPAFTSNGAPSILSVSAENGIAVEAISPAATHGHLRPYATDVGIVSCYPHRLPEDLLQLPRLGCFNLHPSPLPAYRGPAPLFWQLRHGASHAGITLHRMDRHIDAGGIVFRAMVPIEDAVSETELIRICATRGIALIDAALHLLNRGTLQVQPQDENLASYQGWPTERDFQIATDWPLRRITNFIQGTRQRGWPYRLEIGSQHFLLDSVLESSPELLPGKTHQLQGNCLEFNCYDGLIVAQLAQ